jgi:hypothetical protein
MSSTCCAYPAAAAVAASFRLRMHRLRPSRGIIDLKVAATAAARTGYGHHVLDMTCVLYPIHQQCLCAAC